jgi:hypothetical protein
MPRHPPCTLSSLTTFIDHRHVTPQNPEPQLRGELTFADPIPAFRRAPAGVRVRFDPPDSLRTKTLAYASCSGASRLERIAINNGSISPKRCSTTSFTPAGTEKPNLHPAGERCREDSIRYLPSDKTLNLYSLVKEPPAIFAGALTRRLEHDKFFPRVRASMLNDISRLVRTRDRTPRTTFRL